MRRKIFFSFKWSCYTSKSKGTKCNGLHFIELWKFRKQVQEGVKSNVRVSRSVKGCYIYYKNAILISLTVAGCIADPENPEMSIMDPGSSEFRMMLFPRSWNHWNIPFFDFHGDLEIFLSVNRIELTIN